MPTRKLSAYRLTNPFVFFFFLAENAFLLHRPPAAGVFRRTSVSINNLQQHT